jgi:ABC-type transporter Mla MlaB component
MPYALPATVTMHNAAATSAALSQALRTGERVVDAAAVNQADSSLIALLLQARRSGPDVRIEGLPKRAQQLAALYGVQDLLHAGAAAHHS